nr:hypothetical protein [Tanacetum cinerariifolium]
TTTPTTTVTNAQLQTLIDRGVAAALAERDADRSMNGKFLGCVLPRTQGCVLVLRFVSCDLALRFGYAFCLIEDLIAFCLGEALPNSKPCCVLSQNSLRFVSIASTSGTQHDRAPVYDTDGSAEYGAKWGTVETSSTPNEEICAHQETVYRNLVDQVAQKMALGYLNPSYLKKIQLKQQSLYNGDLLLKEHDPPAVYDLEETLELAQESREKMRLLKKEIKPTNYAKINNLSGVFVPQTTKSKEELFLSNVSNMVTASKTISIPNEDLSDDTTPSVARKFLNEVKSSLVTLQHVVKQKMTLEVHNWSSFAHKEAHIIISHEITPIINQVDARVQNFEIQFLQEAAKFIRDFKSLAKEADESLDKQKSL